MKSVGWAIFFGTLVTGKYEFLITRLISHPTFWKDISEDGEHLPPSRVEATAGAAGPVRAAGAPTRADRPGRAVARRDRGGAMLSVRVSLLPDHGVPSGGGPGAGARRPRRAA